MAEVVADDSKAAEPARAPAAVPAPIKYQSRVATATPGLRGSIPNMPPYTDRHPGPPTDRSRVTPRVSSLPVGAGVRRPNAALENQRYAAKTMAAAQAYIREVASPLMEALAVSAAACHPSDVLRFLRDRLMTGPYQHLNRVGDSSEHDADPAWAAANVTPLLKELAKAMVTARAPDPVEFAADFINDKLAAQVEAEDAAEAKEGNPGDYAGGDGEGEGEGAADPVMELSVMSNDEIQELIAAIFREADVDGNGYLDRAEFKAVVERFTSELGIGIPDVRQALREADENDDGCIEYGEFVPLAADIIATSLANRAAMSEEAAREASAVEQARHFLVRGMSSEELEEVLKAMFNDADADGNGTLSRAEFTAALRKSGLGLSRAEINLLMSEVDSNRDGVISYDEFLPLCFNMLTEIVAAEYAAAAVPADEAEIAAYLQELFRSADLDPESSGRKLPIREVAALLGRAELGLSAVQIASIVGSAEVFWVEPSADEEGKAGDPVAMIDYDSFARHAAVSISAIVYVSQTAEKAEAFIAERPTQESLLEGRPAAAAAGEEGGGDPAAQFKDAVLRALMAADESRSGKLRAHVAYDVLVSEAVGLSSGEAHGVVTMAIADAMHNPGSDEDDVADWEDPRLDVRMLAARALDVVRTMADNALMARM